jgi:SAM-dependent methyltransferase
LNEAASIKPIRPIEPNRPAHCPVCGEVGRHLYEKGGHQVHRCRGCGLGFVADLPSAEDLERFYADHYYERPSADKMGGLGYHTAYHELEPGLKRMYGDFLDTVEKQHPGRRFERVLDVGCAYGFFLDVARERLSPLELVGLDITPEAEGIRERGYSFQHGFIEDVDLPQNHFDLVFMGDAFEHVRDPIRVADRLSSVLAPGGVLLLTTVDFDAPLARILGRRWRLMKPPEHLFYWNRQSLARIFGDRGLEGRFGNYWLYLPKRYVYTQFALQFGVKPRFLRLWPGEEIPIWSFDVLLATFEKPVRRKPVG